MLRATSQPRPCPPAPRGVAMASAKHPISPTPLRQQGRRQTRHLRSTPLGGEPLGSGLSTKRPELQDSKVLIFVERAAGELRPVEDPAEFDEGAEQVRRLLQRDRKELMGLEEIGTNLKTEFDDDAEDEPKTGTPAVSLSAPDPQRAFRSKQATTSRPSGAAGASKNPLAGTPNSMASPFGGPIGTANPFSGARGERLFTENDAFSLAPEDSDSRPWWQQIKLGQIVIVLSFTTIISLMLGTFWVVVKLGGVRFNE